MHCRPRRRESERNNDNDGVGELIACLGMVSSAAIFSIINILSTSYNL